ncbi:von Hippel-Lindau disease tumor suppressor-like [Mizuhopecten yessoensis]|uniref:von Hippel-Lindau disease tumor suppressor-like n=1 Tax=Mizuhopecten yessoensis TaxID=6573 RepID=UPI000B4595F7|nr:von Hippel-Lindau disease tumor suppressor-like [Mizuhopecten yessoensis]
MAESNSRSSDSEEYSSKIRSLNNDVCVNVQFANRSGRTASLLWYNFKGVFVKYAILHNNDFMDMHTYVTHPWGARDATTGNVLNIGGQSVYYPQSPVHGDDDNDDEKKEYPLAYIDLPLYSLKEICLHQVQKLYPKKKITTIADVLPRTLVTDLKEGGKHEVHYLYKNMKVSRGSHVEHTCGEDGLVEVVNLDGKNIPMGDHQLANDSEDEATARASSDKKTTECLDESSSGEDFQSRRNKKETSSSCCLS